MSQLSPVSTVSLSLSRVRRWLRALAATRALPAAAAVAVAIAAAVALVGGLRVALLFVRRGARRTPKPKRTPSSTSAPAPAAALPPSVMLPEVVPAKCPAASADRAGQTITAPHPELMDLACLHPSRACADSIKPLNPPEPSHAAPMTTAAVSSSSSPPRVETVSQCFDVPEFTTMRSKCSGPANPPSNFPDATAAEVLDSSNLIIAIPTTLPKVSLYSLGNLERSMQEPRACLINICGPYGMTEIPFAFPPAVAEIALGENFLCGLSAPATCVDSRLRFSPDFHEADTLATVATIQLAASWNDSVKASGDSNFGLPTDEACQEPCENISNLSPLPLSLGFEAELSNTKNTKQEADILFVGFPRISEPLPRAPSPIAAASAEKPVVSERSSESPKTKATVVRVLSPVYGLEPAESGQFSQSIETGAKEVAHRSKSPISPQSPENCREIWIAEEFAPPTVSLADIADKFLTTGSESPNQGHEISADASVSPPHIKSPAILSAEISKSAAGDKSRERELSANPSESPELRSGNEYPAEISMLSALGDASVDGSLLAGSERSHSPVCGENQVQDALEDVSKSPALGRNQQHDDGASNSNSERAQDGVRKRAELFADAEEFVPSGYGVHFIGSRDTAPVTSLRVTAQEFVPSAATSPPEDSSSFLRPAAVEFTPWGLDHPYGNGYVSPPFASDDLQSMDQNIPPDYTENGRPPRPDYPDAGMAPAAWDPVVGAYVLAPVAAAPFAHAEDAPPYARTAEHGRRRRSSSSTAAGWRRARGGAGADAQAAVGSRRRGANALRHSHAHNQQNHGGRRAVDPAVAAPPPPPPPAVTLADFIKVDRRKGLVVVAAGAAADGPARVRARQQSAGAAGAAAAAVAEAKCCYGAACTKQGTSCFLEH
ncbi:hypothetical protein HDU84_008102 [Entophlyctis sp. JEL0112]|nr:hypothetical protein HDU84_008102 [Entophlyctis sp. JEL0112]